MLTRITIFLSGAFLLNMAVLAQNKPAKPFANGKFVEVTTDLAPAAKAGKTADIYCSLRATPDDHAVMEGKEGWADEKGMGVFEKQLSALPAGTILKILKNSKVKAGKSTEIWYNVTSGGAEIEHDDLATQLNCHPEKFWVKAENLKLAPTKFKKAKKIVFENH